MRTWKHCLALAAGLAVACVVVIPAGAGDGAPCHGAKVEERNFGGPASQHATVSFGQWKTDPPLNRWPNVNPAAANNHDMQPFRVTIRAGGSVSFQISGLHQIAVYEPGKMPEDVDVTNNLLTTTGTPAGISIINDAVGRIYNGPDPSLGAGLARDRQETVQFPEPGLYLVICGIRSHFVNDQMYGWVRVLPGPPN